ncbi:MAG: HEAT repeat domain-containing protein [Leptolyngbyaceae cyanobacterium RU_5_1]|nr:HEAT repeat domain-containing protein [Leptolyngbyaceae cyanobacterium RU_5_1]
MGQLQQSAALEPLIQLLADEDAGVRLHAIAALKTLDPHAAYQRLQVLQSRPDLPEALRQGVAIALTEWQIEWPQ